MANLRRGEVAIDLDRERKLKFDLNALAEFEALCGEPVYSVFMRLNGLKSAGPQEILGLVGMKVLRGLLWAALLHDEPQLTARQAGDLLEKAEGDGTIERYFYVLDKLANAWIASLGPKAQKKIQELAAEQAKRDGTGESPNASASDTSASGQPSSGV